MVAIVVVCLLVVVRCFLSSFCVILWTIILYDNDIDFLKCVFDA
jgi:hypothetical protein